MDFIDYSDKLAGPPQFSVTASTASPKTCYHAATDIIYINVGSGWVPMAQPSSRSVYSGYTALSASTQTNVLNNLTTTSNPGPHVATKTTDIVTRVIQGH